MQAMLVGLAVFVYAWISYHRLYLDLKARQQGEHRDPLDKEEKQPIMEEDTKASPPGSMTERSRSKHRGHHENPKRKKPHHKHKKSHHEHKKPQHEHKKPRHERRARHGHKHRRKTASESGSGSDSE